MQTYDVAVVGGGPSGSAAAKKLIEAGRSVALFDRDQFPRTKLCAGWITPDVVEDLGLNVDEYPHRFNTFESIVVHVKGITFRLNNPQHSIRRFEFDDYLLKNSGADIFHHNVKSIRQENDQYVLNDAFRAKYLIGAGGTRCPVYRHFFKEANPRAKELQAATLEEEFPYEWTDSRCHLWFFDRGLPGYAWYVPKENGYLNCGIGGMAEKLKARNEDIKSHWQHFTGVLKSKSLVTGYEYKPKGYSYYLRGDVEVVRVGNAFITGDSAGLATRDLCEGIGPAITSGHLAAASILTGATYNLEAIETFSAGRGWVRNILEYFFVKRNTRSRAQRPVTEAA